jgi:hypothetical protein
MVYSNAQYVGDLTALHCFEAKARKGRAVHKCGSLLHPATPLPYSEVQQQLQFPLYGVLSKEVRNLVFEFAFADDNAIAADKDNIFRRHVGSDADIPRPDIAHALLQTCKAIYLEAYHLPMQLNGEPFLPVDTSNGPCILCCCADHCVTGYQSYRNCKRSRPDPDRITPVNKLDVDLVCQIR